MGGYSSLYRNIHGADHVCRTAVNVEWLAELFQKHQLDNGWLTPKALTLLQYAALYHDITAEIDAKHLEELNAAAAMEKDLIEQITKEDQELLQDVISALRNKNVNDMPKDKVTPPFSPDQEGIRERLFRRILRMADSIEITRCFTVDDDFAEFPRGKHRFNIHYSDVPKSPFYICPEFRQELIAGVENMMDLGFMTGGQCPDDLRRKGNYGTRFCLRDSPADHRKRQIVVNHAPDVYQKIQREQDLLIGRRIATELGYHPYIRLGTDTNGTDLRLHLLSDEACQRENDFLNRPFSQTSLTSHEKF